VTPQEAFSSAVWQAQAELELTRGEAGQGAAGALARWAEATDAAEAEYCRAAGRPPGSGWYPWIRHEPAGRHDHLMRLRACLLGGYDPE